MLGIAAVTVFLSAPGQSFSVAAFLDPMLSELRLNRTTYSVAYMTATLISGLALPLVGRAVDRHGARFVLPIIAIGLGLSCGWMSLVASSAGLYFGFTMIRTCGQGAMMLISSWIVGEWFHTRRGRAAGICAVGGTASVFIVPQLNNALIDSFGWRNTWWMLGAIVVAALAVPSAVLLRDRPEELGLLPDCEFPPEPDEETHTQLLTEAVENSTADRATPEQAAAFLVTADASFTVREAVCTSAFWKVLSVVCVVSLVGTGLVFHQVSILAELNVSRSAAISAISVQAIAATISSIAAGYAAEIFPIRFVLACSMLLEICALSLLLNLPSPGWAFVYSALVGLHGGIIRSAGSIVWITYFGRSFQGAIQGVSGSVTILSAALGPVPLAWCFDHTQSYRGALTAFLILPTLAGLLILSARPPEPIRRNPPL